MTTANKNNTNVALSQLDIVQIIKRAGEITPKSGKSVSASSIFREAQSVVPKDRRVLWTQPKVESLCATRYAKNLLKANGLKVENGLMLRIAMPPLANPPKEKSEPRSKKISSDAEVQFLQYDKILRSNLSSFVESGDALRAIADRKLYLVAGYDSWLDYAKGVCNLNGSAAYSLIRTADYAKAIKARPERSNWKHPIREQQLRPLIKLSVDQTLEVWSHVCATMNNRQPSSRTVRIAAQLLFPHMIPTLTTRMAKRKYTHNKFLKSLKASNTKLTDIQLKLLEQLGKLL